MSAPIDPVTGLDLFIHLVEEEFLRTYDGSADATTGKQAHSAHGFPEMVRNELVSRCMDAWLVMETALRTHFNKAAANLSKQDDQSDEGGRRPSGDSRRDRRREASSFRGSTSGPRPPKRVITAYFQFCREQRPRVTQEMHSQNLSMSLIDVTRELAKRWNEMPAVQRARFEQLAAEDKRRYDQQMAEFRRRKLDQNDEDDEEAEAESEDQDDNESVSAMDTAIERTSGYDDEDPEDFDEDADDSSEASPEFDGASPGVFIDSDEDSEVEVGVNDNTDEVGKLKNFDENEDEEDCEVIEQNNEIIVDDSD